jgi:hypothetical protein
VSLNQLQGLLIQPYYIKAPRGVGSNDEGGGRTAKICGKTALPACQNSAKDVDIADLLFKAEYPAYSKRG